MIQCPKSVFKCKQTKALLYQGYVNNKFPSLHAGLPINDQSEKVFTLKLSKSTPKYTPRHSVLKQNPF